MTQPLTERLRELLAKCSKGPWTIGRRSKFKLAIDAPHSRHEWTALAKVVVAMEDIDGIATPSEEGEANAQLIVLAPDMAQRIIALEATQAELVEALKPLRSAYDAYVNVMKTFSVVGGTLTERRFSEGEREETAMEAAWGALSTIGFDQLFDAHTAIAKLEAGQ